MQPSVVIDSIEFEQVEDTACGDRRRSFVMGHHVARGTVYTEAGAFEFNTPLTMAERNMPYDAAITAVRARIAAMFKEAE